MAKKIKIIVEDHISKIETKTNDFLKTLPNHTSVNVGNIHEDEENYFLIVTYEFQETFEKTVD